MSKRVRKRVRKGLEKWFEKSDKQGGSCFKHAVFVGPVYVRGVTCPICSMTSVSGHVELTLAHVELSVAYQKHECSGGSCY